MIAGASGRSPTPHSAARETARKSELLMEIQLLGTAAAEGWPGLFCRCEACGKARKLRGKNIRTRSGALIDDVLKIDFPPDTLHQALTHNVDLACLQALLFTHAHDDHFCLEELQYLGKHFVIPPRNSRLPVYGPPEVMKALSARYGLTDVPVELRPLTAWQTAQVGNYRVTPILAQHDPAMMCYNYLIEDADGATLLYATDTGWYEDATRNFLRSTKFDGVVIECTNGPKESDYTGHLGIAQVLALREEWIQSGSLAPESPFVTTHFSHHGGLMHDELEAALAPHKIKPAYDGMRFTVAKRN